MPELLYACTLLYYSATVSCTNAQLNGQSPSLFLLNWIVDGSSLSQPSTLASCPLVVAKTMTFAYLLGLLCKITPLTAASLVSALGTYIRRPLQFCIRFIMFVLHLSCFNASHLINYCSRVTAIAKQFSKHSQ